MSFFTCKCIGCVQGITRGYFYGQEISYNFHNAYTSDLIILNDNLDGGKIKFNICDVKYNKIIKRMCFNTNCVICLEQLVDFDLQMVGQNQLICYPAKRINQIRKNKNLTIFQNEKDQLIRVLRCQECKDTNKHLCENTFIPSDQCAIYCSCKKIIHLMLVDDEILQPMDVLNIICKLMALTH